MRKYTGVVIAPSVTAITRRRLVAMDEIDRIVDAYAMWLRSWGAAKTTVTARRNMADSRIRAWGLDGFTTDNITAYLAGPQSPDKKPWSRWTRSTYHNHLTDLCAWLTSTGYIDEDPMPDVRKPKRGSNNPRPLSEPEVAKVLSIAQCETRDWILLALNAGLRASEVAKIHGEDVSVDGIHVEGKGGTIVTLPCHPDLWEMAQRYARYGYWFPGDDNGHISGQHVSLVVGKLFTAFGIQGSIHRCRHVYATRLLRSGTNIRTVQKLMRHANLDTTANYTAVDEDELRAAINLLPSTANLPVGDRDDAAS